MDNSKEFICLSLCSGYGGLELGLKQACPNVRTVAYVEVEAFACANLVAKMEKGLLDVAPIWTDIKTFNGQPFRGKVDIVTTGYPCQGESHAGKRLGKSDPRWLWPYIERIIEAVRPVWFFGENVSGHLTLGFPTVYRSLHNLGYKVEAGLFTAAECGAPHRRERLFILAHARNTESGRLSNCQRQKDSTIRRTSQCQNQKCVQNVASQQSRGESVSQGKYVRDADPPLANTSTTELQGRKSQQENNGTERQAITGSCDKWPARPGQPQYEWEEPRIVAESNKCRHRRHRSEAEQNSNKQKNRISQPNSEHKERQAQSSVGRTAYGTSCRVDRLRLLGNGVVPQQAEKAFRYLINKFQK